eukprot:403366614
MSASQSNLMKFFSSVNKKPEQQSISPQKEPVTQASESKKRKLDEISNIEEQQQSQVSQKSAKQTPVAKKRVCFFKIYNYIQQLNSDAKVKSQSKSKTAAKSEEEKKPIKEVEEEKQHSSVQTASSTTSTITNKTLNGENKQPAQKPGQTVPQIDSQYCLDGYDRFIAELGDWNEPLKPYLQGTQFKQLFKFVQGEYSSQTIYPPRELIFNAFKHVHWDNLKVVIVGQDPYINQNEAMGLCFSIPKGTKVPPSLRNIYKALENDSKIDFKMPNPIHGDLTKWASQGILLLNAVMTVRKGISNSHAKKGWEQFTDQVVNVINQKKEGVVFMLWGKSAQEKAKNVNTKKHLVLKFVHPSPLAGAGFPQCPHFSQTNEYLTQQSKSEIDWQV